MAQSSIGADLKSADAAEEKSASYFHGTRICILAGSILPLLVLCGWAFHFDLSRAVFTTLPTMVPLSGICLLFLATSAWLGPNSTNTKVSRVYAGAALLLSLVNLCGYIVDLDRILDFRQMSPQTSMAIALIAISHLIISAKRFERSPLLRVNFQTLNLIALTLSLLALLGYIYRIVALFGLSEYIGMSVLTAFSVLCLSTASLRMEPEFGTVRAVRQENSAGAFARQFIIGGVFMPFLFAGLIQWEEVRHNLTPEFGMAVFVFFVVITIIGLGVVTMRSLEKLESQKMQIISQEVQVREAKEASRMRERFLANMGHEVRTPLTAILGYLDFIRDPLLSIEERMEMASRARRSATSLLAVLDNVLDFSRSTHDRLTANSSVFSLQDVIHGVSSQFYLEAKTKKIAIQTYGLVELPRELIGDAPRVQQILTNLVSNAVKFTETGTVEISAAFLPQESNRGEIVIQIRDSGIGIPETAKPKLFTSFFQVDDSITRRFGGSGIGLALSRNLSELLSGSLVLKSSAVGQGSTFEFRFPCERVAQPQVPGRSQVASEAPQLENIRVLLVEDNPDNRFLITRYLTQAGASVEFAENGQVGAQMALAGRYSIVLMDIQMPVMDGLQATRLLRQSGFVPPIVALSAHSSSEHLSRSIEAGCDAHAVKPITKEKLISLVKEVSALH